jgi:hypothetical protein
MTRLADRERLAAALHVTNGDVTVDLLRRAGLATDALSWADVLHEGPVPGGLADDELRRVRAGFIAAADGVDAGEVRPFLGDLWCFRMVARLAGARVPLLELDPQGDRVTAATRLRWDEGTESIAAPGPAER